MGKHKNLSELDYDQIVIASQSISKNYNSCGPQSAATKMVPVKNSVNLATGF